MSRLQGRVRSRLAAWESSGLLRTLRPPQGIDLSSNDYLNLAKHPAVVARMLEGVAREGCGSTGSRLLRGERQAFNALERRFADFKGTDRALFFGAGYLANLGAITALADSGDIIFSDERNHASLIDATRLSRASARVFPHNDVVAVARMLAGAPAGAVHFLIVESLFSMDGDFAPLGEYAALCASTGAVLIVDEAHAVGICGERGSGLLESAGIDANSCISVNSAGKALGVSGAFVAGPSWAIEYLVQRARPFVFSTAPSPGLADAIDASLSIVSSEPERREQLTAKATYLRSRLRAVGIPVSPGPSHIVPILLDDVRRATAVAEALQQQGFDVRAIRPPTVPEGSARLRLSVNVGLSTPTLDRFVCSLARAMKEARICTAACS